MRTHEPEAVSTIDRIDAWLCRIPLSSQPEVAGTRLVERDYAVVRMRDSDGVEGCAFGLARGAPVDLVVADTLAPALVDCPADPPSVAARCADLLLILGVDGITGRARSLLDICAWDIAAQRAAEPVWRLLNPSAPTEQEPLSCMLVEGYPVSGKPVEELVERMGRAAESGFAALKLTRAGDDDQMDRVLALTRAIVGPDTALTLDCTWSWRTAAAAEPAARRWARHDLAWIEDPLPASMTSEIAALRRACTIPIAAGDEVTSPETIASLARADAIDVVRLDATAIGGFSGFARIVENVPRLPVSPHVFPEIHRHCARAWERVRPVELFRPAAGFDAAHEFAEPISVRNGTTDAPTEPGLGLAIDWSVVRGREVRHSFAETARAMLP